MGGIDYRACMGRMSRQTGHNSSHRGMAVYQLKAFLFHKGTQLAIDFKICRFEGTANKVNLMAYDTGSIQTMVVCSIGGGIIVGGIVNLKSHALKNMDIVHFKLRNKTADGGNQKGFFRI